MTVQAEESIADSIEAKYAKRLAANEKKIRDKAFNELKSYLVKKSMEQDGFTRDEMLRIWKGLFYCLWMSDKPLVQEELAKNIAELLPLLRNSLSSMLFCETFVSTMEREWHGIDRLRMDKFYLLIRLMLHQIFVLLKNNSWSKDLMEWYDKFLKKGPVSPWSPNPTFSTGSPLGLRLHFIDIFVDELTKFGHNLLKPEQITQLLQPFCQQICETKVLALRRRSMANVFQELIDQSDAVAEAVADVVEMNDLKRLNCDYAAIASSLIEIINEKKVCRPNRDYIAKLVKKLKDVAEGHIPLNIVPDFGGEDLNDDSDMKKAEEDLVKRLCEEMEVDAKERKLEKKQYQKEMKKIKRQANDLPFSNPDLRQNVDFDRIANMRVEGEDEESLSFGEKMKQKRKAKTKKTNENKKQVAKETPKRKNAKLGLDVMKNDLVEEPVHQEEMVTVNAVRSSRKRKTSIEKLGEIKDSELDVDEVKALSKKRRTAVVKPLPAEDIEVLSRFAMKKASSKRMARAKTNKKLLSKLLEDDIQPERQLQLNTSPVTKPTNQSVAPVIENAEATEKKSSSKLVDAKTKRLAEILGTDISQATIVKQAIEAAKKPAKKLRKRNIESLQENAKATGKNTPKKVSFQMSKIQVQRFRKTDKSSVLSPTPSAVAFDPDRTPNCGLLKKTSKLLKKRKSPTKPIRKRASDFF